MLSAFIRLLKHLWYLCAVAALLFVIASLLDPGLTRSKRLFSHSMQTVQEWMPVKKLQSFSTTIKSSFFDLIKVEKMPTTISNTEKKPN